MIQPEERAVLPDKKLEKALAAVYRSVSVHQFYPHNHPTLAQALEEGYQAWCSVEEDYRWQEYGLQLRSNGFWLGETRLGENSPAVSTLARVFGSHALVSVRRTGQLSLDGFSHWVSLLATSPDVLAPQGGVAGAWKRSAYAEALDLRGLKTVVRDGPPGSPAPVRSGGKDWGAGLPGSDGEVGALADPSWLGRLQSFQQRSPKERRLLEILLRLGSTDEVPTLRAVLREVAHDVEGYLNEERYREAFHVILYLYREAQNLEAGGKVQARDCVLGTVRQLVRGDFLQWLIGHVASSREAEDAEVGAYILRFLGEGVAVALLNALVAEKSRAGRRRLLNVLVGIGQPLVPWAIRMLEDQRWYVVRNMITLLGGVGTPEAVKALMRLSRDPDSRLRKEVARALGRVRREGAEEELRRLLEDPNPAVRLMAVSSSSFHPSDAMLRSLWRAYQEIGIRSPNWKAKMAILRAMGRMGLPAGAEYLAAVLRKRPLLRRSRWQTVKLAAIQAAGELGGEKALALLAPLRDHKHPEMRNAVVRALAALEGRAQRGTP